MNRSEADERYYTSRGYEAGIAEGGSDVWSNIDPPGRNSSPRLWVAWEVGYAAGVAVAEQNTV